MKLDWKGAGTLGVVGGGLLLAAVVISQSDEPAQQPAVAGVAEPAAAPAAVSEPAPAAEPAGSEQTAPPSVEPATKTLVANGEEPQSKFVHYRVGQRNVKSIFADDNGVMWVGTSGGVIRYDLQSGEYRHYDVRNGLLANGVFSVGRVADQVAVGTYGGGLALLDEGAEKWKIYNVPEGLGDAFVYDALEAKNGDVWIATWTGVNRVRGGRMDDASAWEVFTVANTQGGLPNDWVYGLAEGRDGIIWLATEGGLARFKDDTWTNWKHQDGLGAPYDQVKDQNVFSRDPARYSSHHARQKVEQGLQDVDTAYNPNYIVSLEVAADGSVWAGTWGGGLGHFDGETWTNYTVSDGLPSNHIFMLHRDREDRLWVGTSHGLARMKAGGGFDVFTREDGLYSNTVFSMATEQDGTLWVGSFGGVAKINHLP